MAHKMDKQVPVDERRRFLKQVLTGAAAAGAATVTGCAPEPKPLPRPRERTQSWEDRQRAGDKERTEKQMSAACRDVEEATKLRDKYFVTEYLDGKGDPRLLQQAIERYARGSAMFSKAAGPNSDLHDTEFAGILALEQAKRDYGGSYKYASTLFAAEIGKDTAYHSDREGQPRVNHIT